MRDERLDRITIAGLTIATLIMVTYVIYDYIDRMHPDLSFLTPSVAVGVNLPNLHLPNFNLDWFQAMDPVSKLIFSFLMVMLVSTALGCGWVLIKYRKNRAQH